MVRDALQQGAERGRTQWREFVDGVRDEHEATPRRELSEIDRLALWAAGAIVPVNVLFALYLLLC